MAFTPEKLKGEDITPDDVRTLFDGMAGKRETKVKCKNVLNMRFKLAVKKGLMKRNFLESASFRLKSGAGKETVPYLVEEMRYLVEYIADRKQSDDRADPALQSLQPLRLEEVLGLQWQDIDRENMVLHIRRAVTHPTRHLSEIKETKTSKCREVAWSSIALIVKRTIFGKEARQNDVCEAKNLQKTAPKRRKSPHLQAFLTKEKS